MRACAAASDESKRSWAINGAAPAIAIAAKMVQSLLVSALSPPPAATRPPTASESAAAAPCAESAAAKRAPGSHAREAVVALHARHTTVVITAEGTVIARPIALLKTRISETLLRLAATKALAPRAAESASLAAAETATTGGPKPSGHRAIGIRNAESVFRIMIPH